MAGQRQMTPEQVLETVAGRFPADDVSEIQQALSEAEAEFARGEGFDEAEMLRHFGLR
jgi:hypothetical protein